MIFIYSQICATITMVHFRIFLSPQKETPYSSIITSYPYPPSSVIPKILPVPIDPPVLDYFLRMESYNMWSSLCRVFLHLA